MPSKYKSRGTSYVVAEHGDKHVEEVSVTTDGPTVAFGSITFTLVVQRKEERRATELVRPCFNVSIGRANLPMEW